jgi:hypothetical protein
MLPRVCNVFVLRFQGYPEPDKILYFLATIFIGEMLCASLSPEKQDRLVGDSVFHPALREIQSRVFSASSCGSRILHAFCNARAMIQQHFSSCAGFRLNLILDLNGADE